MSQQQPGMEIASSIQAPWLAEALAERQSELIPRVESCYTQLRVLPRRARRELQRRLARSRDLAVILENWLHHGPGRTLQRRLARSIVGAALLLALGQGVGQAATTITVTTNVPAINGSDGKCSLIEAIVNANDGAATHPDCAGGSGPQTIVLPKSTHTLVAVDNSDYGDTGVPVIKAQITIEGNGAKIARKASAPAFRLIAVGTGGDLTLKNLTLSKGMEDGGAILNAYGTVRIENSTISGNSACCDYGFGGAIYNAGDLTIQNSKISGNKTGGYFGYGGAIYNTGNLTIENSTISGNRANGKFSNIGGGIAHFGTGLIIRNSTISGNTSSGKAFGDGGGLYNGGSSATIENSTISGNKASGAYGYGGAILNTGDLTITNSTISKNTAGSGGGVSNHGVLAIRNGTISGNKASNKNYGYGGGIDNFANLTLSRSLISGNKATFGPEVFHLPAGSITVDDFNLFGFNGAAGVDGFSPGPNDIVPAAGVNVGDILKSLASNGGPTKTQALVPGSPAVNAVPSSNPGCTGTDQRGVLRPQPTGGDCDIGAFELE